MESIYIEANPEDEGSKYVPDWNIRVNDTIFPDLSKGIAQKKVTLELLRGLELPLNLVTLIDLGGRYNYGVAAHLLVKVPYLTSFLYLSFVFVREFTNLCPFYQREYD